MAEKANTWQSFIEAVHTEVHGKVLGWHGENISINLDGFLTAPEAEQKAFMFQMATRGLCRVVAEQISASAVKTVEEATARATYTGELGSYQAGTRVGTVRIDSPEKAAESLYLKNLTGLLKEKNPAAMNIATRFGLGLTDKGRLTGSESEDFQKYLSKKVKDKYWADKGAEEFKRLEVERAAKVGKKQAEANL